LKRDALQLKDAYQFSFFFLLAMEWSGGIYHVLPNFLIVSVVYEET